VALEFILGALLVALLCSVAVQAWMHRTYRRHAAAEARSGQSAERLARSLLTQVELGGVAVVGTPHLLDDRYDARAQVLHTSNPAAKSISALAVTAHEVAHAVQHAQGYWGLRLRRWMQPLGHGGAALALAALCAGWLFDRVSLIWAGGGLYLAAAGLLLLSLPVELDANRRALAMLESGRHLTPDEMEGARRVLGAAALTYVGAALSPLVHGVFLLWSRR
jgi:Zn-dependent membrane protease YugP